MAAVDQIPFEEFKLGKGVGTGSFGSVFVADWRNRVIAVKRIRAGCEDRKIDREINQLARVDHENIIKLYGISKHEDRVYLLMEYVDGGSLFSFLHAQSKPSYSLAHALNWSLQIAQGVAYLHGMRPKAVIHRDIKPHNALLGQRGLSLKICDFGTVVDQTLSMSLETGTVRYIAPEVFKGGRYNEKCDVHSWAITCWEILSRKMPLDKYDGTSAWALKLAINGGERPLLDDVMKGCPEDLNSLLTVCWDVDPKRRFSMELVAHIMKKFTSEAGPIQPLDYVLTN
ncbi:mitogen-activated protein kinase kinase kinase 7 isoform X1 [Drosophila gunungcola]|uniref:mitogen-activated protein kinase kinase kinase 7 isoform X1 n=2 Tax=Drosophila gunungcola TaxID=103775 RepID=UPI0022E1D67D|nr:mitogen-activated protein kinase kinase kinase 7 isoform X1 [Drosophila gunungcola]